MGSRSSSLVKVLVKVLVWVLLPVLIYAYIYSPRVNGAVDLYHEGEKLAPFQAAVDGALPYKDVYIQHGLIRNFYLPQVAASVFGPTLSGLRKFIRVLEPLPYVLFYLMGLLLFSGSVFTSLLLMFFYSSEQFWISPRFGLGALSAFLILFWIKHRSKSFVLYDAGFIAAFAFWYSAEVGVYAFVSGSLFLLLYGFFVADNSERDRRGYDLGPWIRFTLGASLGFALVGGYLVYLGVFGDFIRNTYIQFAYQLETWGMPFPSFPQALAEGPFSHAFRMYLPIAVFILSSLYLTFCLIKDRLWRSTGNLSVLFLTIASFIYFRTALGRSDYGHWIDGSTFYWLLLFLPFDYFWKRGWKVSVGMAAGLLFFYFNSFHHPLSFAVSRIERIMADGWTDGKGYLHPRIGRAGVPQEQLSLLQGVVTYIHEETVEDDYIYDFSNQGGYYFFANRRVPTRYFQVAYAVTPEMQSELIASLEDKKPKLVIWKTGGWFDAIDGISREKRQPLVAKYLQDNFQVAAEIGQTVLMKPKT